MASIISVRLSCVALAGAWILSGPAFAEQSSGDQQALVLGLQQDEASAASRAKHRERSAVKRLLVRLQDARDASAKDRSLPGVEGPNHPEIEDHASLVRGLRSGRLSLDDVRRRGLSVFSTPFNRHDGFGDGPFDPVETDTRVLGHRPTLQGNGLSLRLNGLDAQSCNECHTLLSSAERPPTLGIGGVGSLVTNAIIMPSMIDVADSFDGRVIFQPGGDPNLPLLFDGIADFNGRYANPPFLFGGGGIELLAKEMTRDLQDSLELAKRSPRGTVVRLRTHGVDFGFLRSLGSGRVDMRGVEGLGPEKIDKVPPEQALVVRPFGRKGENFSMRDFDRGAMQFHFGIQPVEVVGDDVDEDNDGLANEVTVGELTALHVFDVTNVPPFIERLGFQGTMGLIQFLAIGCAECHTPVMRTESRSVPLAHPEVPEDPDANVYAEIDLVDVGFTPAPRGGVFVPLFADLKRHDMGPRLAETFDVGELGNTRFTTARLWGVADTAPYLHDGRATTLFDAIELHGGEAQAARDAFLALAPSLQHTVIAFLQKLRTPKRPNEELTR